MTKRLGRPLGTLNPRIVAAAIDGQTPAEIAAALGCSPVTVAVVLSRARRRGVEIPKQKCGPRGRHGWRERQAA